MKDATKLVMKTRRNTARGNERNPDCIRGLPVRFNSSLSLRGHRSYLIIKPNSINIHIYCFIAIRRTAVSRGGSSSFLFLTGPRPYILPSHIVIFFGPKKKKIYCFIKRRLAVDAHAGVYNEPGDGSSA
ncbi:hypothetical protein OUZ56_002862 [Daphnia magna]|uniref:Uncharacterized protein n=1 Tax=Daphnia magna TaxID=35525 RepID=A0ABR0A704_9CRUS|nr:hypothetical protein OUZ56_002862 [Daphnia magna]